MTVATLHFGLGLVAGDGARLRAPSADGTSGQALVTDGSGQLSFDDVTTDLSPLTLSENLVEQYNGLNPQAYALYGTRTAADDYERLRIYGDGSAYYLASEAGVSGGVVRNIVIPNGSVGVGTNPATKLVLAGNNNRPTVVDNNFLRFVDTDTSALAGQPLGKIEFYSSDASDPGAGVKAYIGAFANSATPGAYLAFGTDALTGTPTEWMRIDADGHVGIGTDDPAAKLHIDGTVQFDNLPTSDPLVAGQLWNDAGTVKVSAG